MRPQVQVLHRPPEVAGLPVVWEPCHLWCSWRMNLRSRGGCGGTSAPRVVKGAASATRTVEQLRETSARAIRGNSPPGEGGFKALLAGGTRLHRRAPGLVSEREPSVPIRCLQAG